VRRDYQNGVIEGGDWNDQRAEPTAEPEASTALVETARDRVAKLEASDLDYTDDRLARRPSNSTRR
jgi:hypothetical protein